jgi:hypothetical protein
LWPYLVANFGLGIIWAAVVGITFQFFINMEIERYSILHGESVFVGYSEISKKLPYWFILSTFLAWIWPGIIAVSAKIFSNILGINNFSYLAIAFLLLIGLILTLGPKLYKTVESFQKIIIFVGIPLIAIVVFLIARHADYIALANGLIGIGNGFSFIPRGIPIFTFLGAVAYSGAGGNLNLAQSFYVKEKGYGMCYGVKGITSVLTGKAQKVKIYGQKANFDDATTYQNFKKWWKLINFEHFLVFLLMGIIAILLLALLAYSTAQFLPQEQNVGFLLKEAETIGFRIFPFAGILFLITIGTMLFATQLNILDSTSRIISENLVIIKNKLNLSKTYYIILWLQIIAGIIIFSFGYFDPVQLIIIGAVINAFAMLFHIAATYLLNKKLLPKIYQPSLIRKIILLIAWLTFVVLFILAIVEAFK